MGWRNGEADGGGLDREQQTSTPEYWYKEALNSNDPNERCGYGLLEHATGNLPDTSFGFSANCEFDKNSEDVADRYQENWNNFISYLEYSILLIKSYLPGQGDFSIHRDQKNKLVGDIKVFIKEAKRLSLNLSDDFPEKLTKYREKYNKFVKNLRIDRSRPSF